MNSTIQIKRTRKLLLFLPLLIVPLLTVVFWKFNNRNSAADGQTKSQGLNTRLPGAKFDKHTKTLDKMSFYQQAAQDSGKSKLSASNSLLQKFGFKPNPAGDADASVNRINQKLAEINQQMGQPRPKLADPAPVTPDRSLDKEVSKLESLMKTMNNSQDSDPQMQQLSNMLGQIQSIQNPQKTKPIETQPDTPFRAIPAVVDGNQKILQGGVVRIRLTDTVRIKGALLDKSQLLFGSCNITNQRLLLDIKNIRVGHAIIPVNLTVFSLDGLPGIPAPEAELGGAAAGGADNAIQSMQFLSMDQSLGAQAAAGGVNAAKGLFSKKVKKIKVKLQDQFPVLLKINK